MIYKSQLIFGDIVVSKVTPEVEAEIVAALKRTKSPFRVASKVGVSVNEVMRILELNEDKLTDIPERHGGLGREDLREFTVARRLASETGWNNSDPKIAQARDDYEAGTHIMTTGRDGAYLILYSIPRKGRPDPNPDYFLPELA